MKAFSLNYFIRSSKTKNKDSGRLYGRLSVSGKRIDFSLNRKIKLSDWNFNSGSIRGRNSTLAELEKYLATVLETFYKTERTLIEKSLPVTCENLLMEFTFAITGTKKNEEKSLLDIIDFNNNQIKELSEIGEIVPSTYKRYLTTKNYVIEFLSQKHLKTNIPLSHLNYSFLSEFDHWLRVKKKCAHNSAMKYIKNLKKIIKKAIEKGWLKNDPFLGFKTTTKPVNRYALNLIELKKIEEFRTDIQRLDKVRKLFLFGCYTGLSYIDIVSLKPTEIIEDNNGEIWIIKPRVKTKIMSRIYLLPKAKEIITFFKSDSSTWASNNVFPPMSNQKLNSYLKEIADLTGILRNLKFHDSRHTFATTITLANGVSIETVSAQLGHSNIKQTQHYAKMVDYRIKKEMKGIMSML